MQGDRCNGQVRLSLPHDHPSGGMPGRYAYRFHKEAGDSRPKPWPYHFCHKILWNLYPVLNLLVAPRQ